MRRRFQKGNVIIRGKTPQPHRIYREDVLQLDGTYKRVRRCVLLGRSVNYQNVQRRSCFSRTLTG